jgi:DNA-binding PadR family transcriptional regulator
MSEARLLWIVRRYPHPTALARHVRDGSVFTALRRLETRGLVTRRQGHYRLTKHGRHELGMAQTLTRLVARTHSGRGESTVKVRGRA